jgi:hypothetical protein
MLFAKLLQHNGLPEMVSQTPKHVGGDRYMYLTHYMHLVGLKRETTAGMHEVESFKIEHWDQERTSNCTPCRHVGSSRHSFVHV